MHYLHKHTTHTSDVLLKLAFLLLSLSCWPTAFAEVPNAAQSSVFDSIVAEPIRVLSGFEVPECTLYDEMGAVLYVSNIVCGPDGHWEDDGQAFLSKVDSDFKVQYHWAVEADGFNAPKGMCILQGYIYYADNSRLVRRSLSQPNMHKVMADGFKMANDVATDGKNIWVSDIALNKIFCVSPDGDKRSIRSPMGVNGISFSKDKMYAVSWSEHDVFEVDPTGEKEPRAFGLSRHFKNLDGLEILPDGTMIVSDFTGDKISLISADRKRTRVLIEIRSPADIGFNPLTNQLAIPQLTENKLAIYQLEWK